MAELESRLDDRELWRCVEHTVREVLLPALAADADWARAAAVQLVGLARYAQRRPGAELEVTRTQERIAALRELSDNPYVAAHWNGELDPDEVNRAIGSILADTVGRVDASAHDVRANLRVLVVRQLDDELVITGPLVQAFRGQLDA